MEPFCPRKIAHRDRKIMGIDNMGPSIMIEINDTGTSKFTDSSSITGVMIWDVI
jgi:hypothetical protein